MPFIQAIFCLKGFDDRSRFFLTSILSLLGFILFSVIFSDYTFVIFISLVLFTAVLTCTTLRRLHDAKLNKNWQFVPGGLLFITATVSLFIEHNSSFYLLVLPALSISLLLTYPSKSKKPKEQYILGYYGPIDLSSYQQDVVVNTTHNQRIEPTLAGNGNNESAYLSDPVAERSITPSYSDESKQVDIGELIRLKLLSNRKFQVGIAVSVLLILVSVLISSLISTSEQQINETTQVDPLQDSVKNSTSTVLTNKSDLLVMPDNFTLFQSEYQGIIIHWQADHVTDGELWSLSSAKGDKSCQTIKFNKGEPLRPLTVIVENGSDYFASFSPLDSKEIIQALAYRGKFSLCGYNFSLKGSQAVLGKHAKYSPFLE